MSDRRRRFGPVRWVGLGLVLAGLAVLGWVGWQFFGTNWVSHRHQAQITHRLRADWAAGKRVTPARVKLGDASALVRIPAFGKLYVVPVLEGANEDNLARGFAHFTQTADPGQVGNYVIAGHRVTHGEPLRQMPSLRPGDRVIVETADATYTYRLDTDPNSLIVSFTAGWILQPVPKNPASGGVEPAQRQGQRLITLVTCSELFHTDNRMVAFGHLVSVVRRPPA